MTSATEPGESTTLSADEAFAVLGEETRLETLRVLGAADDPLRFSDLFDRVDYDDSSNFGYHLEKLVGHFVRKTDDGYDLSQAGRRVVEAVRAGILTDDPVIERTEVGTACYICGEPLAVRYIDERVELYCSACGGVRGGESSTTKWAADSTGDIVGFLDLPPAGVQGRTPSAALRAAEVWTVAETHALARGVCPRCSARVDHSVEVCDDHDAGDGRCDECDQRFGAAIHVRCTNCVLAQSSVLTKHLLAEPDVMAFMIEHGLDPLAPEGFHLTPLDEEIRSTDPFVARFTFAGAGDSITLTVDGDLSVVEATRGDASASPR